MTTSFRQLIDVGDIDGLVRLIDDLTSDRDWDTLFELRTSARAAVTSGRQVWPAATLAEYRLALRAPVSLAARVLDDAGRFTLGPLTEVVAQDHTFADLSPHLSDGPIQAYVAHERAIRGESIDIDVFPALDIPARLARWEPTYLLPTYRDAGLDVATLDLPIDFAPLEEEHAKSIDCVDVTEAFRLLIEPWTTSESMSWSVASTRGAAHSAIRACGTSTGRVASLTSHDALRWLTWIGASGGPDGRRRGNAAGRFSTWWLLAAITDSLATWPPADIERLDQLTWSWWDDGHDRQGWSIGIAVHDPLTQTSWAFEARDRSAS
jgi:hypothetical protein